MSQTAGAMAPPPPITERGKNFDLSIALVLHDWPALTLAVQNSWGGPDSAEKRDWFAGAVSDLYENTPDADNEIDVGYLEEFLLNIMIDEFDVAVEDDSSEEVAKRIVTLRRDIVVEGDFTKLEQLKQRWESRQGGGAALLPVAAKGEEDSESSESEEEMTDAPQPERGPRPPPEVDEDGFTKVTNRRR